jgi:hypothetical protein
MGSRIDAVKFLRRCAVAVALSAAAVSANAHYLWIEKSGDQVVLRFGEFAENRREQSPGRLDEIPDPQAKQLSPRGDKPVALKRGADAFAFEKIDKGAALIAQENGMEVHDWSGAGIGIVKPMFYARAAAAPAKAVMPLDIVPTATAGQYQLWFKDKPLGKTAVTIYAPNGWWQEHKTDGEGRVTLAQPWRGQYVIEAIVLERVPGEFKGKTYEAVRHRATLTIEQSTGAETFAAPAIEL